MAKIDRVEDLPEWFDLKNYQDCQTFTAFEWFACLYIRKSLLHFARFLPTCGSSFSALINSAQKTADELDLLRRNPLNWKLGNGWLWSGIECEEEGKRSPIKELSFEDLFYQYQSDRDSADHGEADEIVPLRWEQIIAEDPYSVPAAIQGAKTGAILDCEPILVNLDASDQELKAAFLRWLAAARQQKPNPSRRGRLFNRWPRYGLLPYLDLLLWSLETDVHIPDRVMSAAISRYDAGEENLRKTVAPLAEALMRDLSSLQALAANQIAFSSQAD